MSRLILVKHAAPQVEPGVAPEQWRLSDRGRASVAPLAAAVGAHPPSLVISSTERKAVETAELIAQALGVDSQTAPGLHEHDRSNVPQLRSSEFISMIELFFRRPTERVLGSETARQAEERFTIALGAVAEAHAEQDIAVVSHSTVIALLLARLSGRSGFQLWRELSKPFLARIESDGRELRFVELCPVPEA
jgi:broad specificity phosphatase PhoE